ncbi:prenyltransferase/squalene oxidase repeat-containing protein [Desulfotomaculum sp. 1211_IL3151]|uniref:prenyltransferase/squalene oxidase repeat-containing protein n=1 Tax=Desulfotomaculum sp. 1211_IL3151 TaxID=3084055 RepID=UPI002FDABB91
MRYRKKPMAYLLGLFVFMLIFPMQALAQPTVDHKLALERATKAITASVKQPEAQFATWNYLALAAAGQNLAGYPVKQVCQKQLASAQTTADDSILILTLLAAGHDPTNFQGQNLIKKIQANQLPNGKFADNSDRSGQGDNNCQVLVNAHIWAILALYAAGADIPDEAKAKGWLIDQQHRDGGFNWYTKDNTSDVDSTGMALMALGALGEKKDSPVVQRAYTFLKNVQGTKGEYASWGAVNAESCAIAMRGLLAVGINPLDAELSKPGGNPVTALLSFQLKDGSFSHMAGTDSNEMATQHALMALADLYYGKPFEQRLREAKNPTAVTRKGSM